MEKKTIFTILAFALLLCIGMAYSASTSNFGNVNASQNITAGGYFLGDGSLLTGVAAGTSSDCNATGSCENVTYMDYDNRGILSTVDLGTGAWEGSTAVDVHIGNASTLGAVLKLGDILLADSNDAFGSLDDTGAFVIGLEVQPLGYYMGVVDSSDQAAFILAEPGTDDNASFFRDSVIVGGIDGSYGLDLDAIDCSTQGFSNIDCSMETEADLGVADDLEVGGNIWLGTNPGAGNLNVTGGNVNTVNCIQFSSGGQICDSP